MTLEVIYSNIYKCFCSFGMVGFGLMDFVSCVLYNLLIFFCVIG